MRATLVCLGAAALLMGACGDDEEAAATPAPTGLPNPATAPAQPTQPQPTQPAQPQGGSMESNFGTITLAPGFTPDPHTVTGTAGGGIDAATWNAACSGWVSQTPDHILQATGQFPTLRVMAQSAGDVTLVVQKPDGTYVCNDDTDGTNPVVSEAFGAGNYKVWIGSYEQGQNAQYTLGVTELPSVTPSSLGS